MFRSPRIIPECLIALGVLCALVGWRLAQDNPAVPIPPSLPLINESVRSVDCGASALYIIGKLSARDRSLDDLRTLTKTTVMGTDMLHLRDAATELGFDVTAVQCSFDRLSGHLANPGCYAILYSTTAHFAAVVRQAGPPQVRMVDAAIGVRDLTDFELREGFKWDGAALLLCTKT